MNLSITGGAFAGEVVCGLCGHSNRAPVSFCRQCGSAIDTASFEQKESRLRWLTLQNIYPILLSILVLLSLLTWATGNEWKSFLALILLFTGILTALTGEIVLVAAGLKQGIHWGIANLLFPIIFAIMHWRLARRGVLLLLIGFALIIFSFIIT
jgi:hypothetical protein